jgi:hypothetical protein
MEGWYRGAFVMCRKEAVVESWGLVIGLDL